MKNRHRVSQVVSKLICSTGGQRKLLKQGIHGERETEKDWSRIRSPARDLQALFLTYDEPGRRSAKMRHEGLRLK